MVLHEEVNRVAEEVKSKGLSSCKRWSGIQESTEGSGMWGGGNHGGGGGKEESANATFLSKRERMVREDSMFVCEYGWLA